MVVRVDLLISLDGFATTTDITPERPFGNDWGRLTASYVATRTFRERVFHDNSGAGTTGVDDAYARAYFENIGAEIMGAGKFGLHNFPNDPNWKGWWGDEPPFHCPVFVLTHRERPTLTVSDTTFHFIDTDIEDALARAEAAAAPRMSASAEAQPWCALILRPTLLITCMWPSPPLSSAAAFACGITSAVSKAVCHRSSPKLPKAALST